MGNLWGGGIQVTILLGMSRLPPWAFTDPGSPFTVSSPAGVAPRFRVGNIMTSPESMIVIAVVFAITTLGSGRWLEWCQIAGGHGGTAW
jgi:hypothetical protein